MYSSTLPLLTHICIVFHVVIEHYALLFGNVNKIIPFFSLCSSFTNPALWTVQVGLTEQPVSGAADRSVMKIFFHRAYHPEGLSYDIALIKLTQPLAFNGESLLLILDPN